MKRNKFMIILSAGFVSASALTSGMAYADDKAEVQMLMDAQHDITAAIKAAEASVGGTATGASFDDDGGKAHFEVDVANAGKKTEVRIDAATGDVTESKDDGNANEQVDLSKLGGSLSEIIAGAESETGGKVMSIDTEHENGEFTGIEIEIANTDGTTQDFFMNAADGKMAPSND